MNPNLFNHSKSSQSSLNFWGGSDVDQVRPDLTDMQSMGLMDQIYPNYLDQEKNFLIDKRFYQL